MNHFRWTITGAALGLLLALGPSCGPSEEPCNALTCNGCCTADGECELGNNALTCGTNGALCQACGASNICMSGVCVPTSINQNPDGGTHCNANNCNGCCTLSGQCITSPDNLNCGSGGEACQTCSGTTTCNTAVGACVDPSCNGCVKNGTCVGIPDQTNALCGSSGATCEVCPSGTACVNGSCASTTGCNAANCPNGCCSGNLCLPGDSLANCGTGGALCDTCSGSETCSGAPRACRTGSTANGAVGSACTTDNDCVSGLECRTQTASGNATYTGGYCSKFCDALGQCGTGAECNYLAELGEDLMCYDLCSPTDPCRTPGYRCWTTNASTGDGICWVDPTPSLPTPPTGVIGKACSTELDPVCTANGTYPAGFCATSAQNFPNGYCLGDCLLTNNCAFDSTCVGFGDDGTGNPEQAFCLETCSNPNGTQDTCRTGYLCLDVGTGQGVCWLAN